MVGLQGKCCATFCHIQECRFRSWIILDMFPALILHCSVPESRSQYDPGTQQSSNFLHYTNAEGWTWNTYLVLGVFPPFTSQKNNMFQTNPGTPQYFPSLYVFRCMLLCCDWGISSFTLTSCFPKQLNPEEETPSRQWNKKRNRTNIYDMEKFMKLHFSSHVCHAASFANKDTHWSGQIISFHQPRCPWNKGISLPQLPFGARPRDVAIVWPDWFNLQLLEPFIDSLNCPPGLVQRPWLCKDELSRSPSSVVAICMQYESIWYIFVCVYTYVYVHVSYFCSYLWYLTYLYVFH